MVFRAIKPVLTRRVFFQRKIAPRQLVRGEMNETIVGSGNSGTPRTRQQGLLQVEMTASPEGSVEVDEATSL
jgi:hypothetical protein